MINSFNEWGVKVICTGNSLLINFTSGERGSDKCYFSVTRHSKSDVLYSLTY